MDIVNVITPLVLIALLGYIATKSQWLQRSQLDALSKFTFNLSIPAFLFFQMANAQFSEQVNWQLFASFYLPVLLCYGVAYLINYFFHHQYNRSSAPSAVFALGASYSNTVIVGLPVLLATLGEQVVAIVFLVITFHSAMLFGLTSAIAAKSERFNWQQFLAQTFNNPLIISILAGLIFNIYQITLPEFVATSLVMMGKPAITLALFVLGASLAFYQVKAQLSFIFIASVCKLLLLPFTVYLCAQHLFLLDSLTVTVLVIMSGSPTGVNAYLIALMQNKHQETVAGSVVVSTLLSIATIPAWLWWLH